MTLYDKIQESVAFIRTKTDKVPSIGMVLGTGLGALATSLENAVSIDYDEIPHFAKTSVEGHAGQLILGTLAGKSVVLMAGRFHYYEGYSMEEITFPIRVMKFLGASSLIITNAAGSTSQHIKGEDIVFIEDHIYLLPENPLRGINDPRLGPRFPEMVGIYSKEWIEAAMNIGIKKGIRVHKGTYACLQGPNLETPAEYRYLHTIGGDVVGMSSIPEVIVAAQMGMKILGISIVSNQSYPTDQMDECTIEEVIRRVEISAPKALEILNELLVIMR